jgi:serralysin
LTGVYLVQGKKGEQMSFHKFDITEIFSNASGTIQFIELRQPDDDPEPVGGYFSGHSITIGDHTLQFNKNLPDPDAAVGKYVLIATAGFQAATGVTPNYIIPNGFLPTSGTLNFAGVDFVTYSGLPTNGHTSLNIDINSGHTQSTGENSPTNFAGDIGHIAVITGTANPDAKIGTSKSDLILGLGGNDTLSGLGANDTLVGAAGADSLLGGDGADILQGGAGADKLKGGGGNDRFVFNEAASNDAIQDFNGSGDKVQLENSVFTGLAVGTVAAGRMQMATEVSATSGDSGDRLKYDTDDGKLYYDADGNGSGALKLIATIHLVAGEFTAADVIVT